MKTLRIDDIEGLPVLGTLMWQPVRKPLGITAFGINAYTAGSAGDEVVEDHTELVDEEVYVVIRGHATFTVDGEDVEAPAVTLVHVTDPKAERVAIAKEDGTVVLSLGATHYDVDVIRCRAERQGLVAQPVFKTGTPA